MYLLLINKYIYMYNILFRIFSEIKYYDILIFSFNVWNFIYLLSFK